MISSVILLKISVFLTQWMFKIKRLLLCFALSIDILSGAASASNTSGVHGTDVNPDKRSLQLRLALSPGDDMAKQTLGHIAFTTNMHSVNAFEGG